MFEESDLFLALAEIAGVFVGFGALIGATRGSKVEASELGRIQGVVTIGLVVVVAALVPVGGARYGMSAGTLWPVSSIVFLVLIWLAILAPLRNPARRTIFLAQAKANPAVTAFFWLCLEVPIQVPLVMVLLGSSPALFPAFYTTALVVNLFEAALLLALLVYAQQDETA